MSSDSTIFITDFQVACLFKSAEGERELKGELGGEGGGKGGCAFLGPDLEAFISFT